MDFKLKDGRTIQLFTNLQIARFIYLAMPFQGLEFAEGVEKPHLIMNNDVEKVKKLSDRVMKQRKSIAVDLSGDYDDEIPF